MSSKQGPNTGQVVGSDDTVFRVRLMEIKARKTLYWMRWRRLSEGSGKAKSNCWGTEPVVTTWPRCAVGCDIGKSVTCLAIAKTVKCGGRDLHKVMSTFVSWEELSTSSTRQRLTSNGSKSWSASASLPFSRCPADMYQHCWDAKRRERLTTRSLVSPVLELSMLLVHLGFFGINSDLSHCFATSSTRSCSVSSRLCGVMRMSEESRKVSLSGFA